MNKTYDKLELGSGNRPSPGYIHVDINPNAIDVDIVGDIRSLFSTDYNIDDYPDLLQLDIRLGIANLFTEIRAIHFIEHVQWLYQKPMFEWFYHLLLPNGRIIIETPDLHWIAKSYIKNHQKRKYPTHEHPNLKEPQDFTAWVNFKLYSGCSLGDYHHCCYDDVWLKYMLQSVGFKASVNTREGTICATGVKSPQFLKTRNSEYYHG